MNCTDCKATRCALYCINFPSNNKEVKRNVSCGDLLYGSSIFSSRGVEEWFDFPRYRVVGIHMNGEIMFLETLNRIGNNIGYSRMNIQGDQWKHWNIQDRKTLAGE